MTGEESSVEDRTRNVQNNAVRHVVCAVAFALALSGVVRGQTTSRYAWHANPTPMLATPAAVTPHREEVTFDQPVPEPQPAADSADAASLWWEQDLIVPILRDRPTAGMTLTQALQIALAEAPELRVLQSDWMIQHQEVCRQDAAFDWTAFVDAIWNRDSAPVGSQLDGATERLRSRTLNSGVGVRRLARDGTEVQLSQGLGLYSSNSIFISPNYQGNSRLSLDFRKPLFRGAGEVYNTAGVQQAQIDQEIAYDRLQAGIQDYLLQVASAYWNLVMFRGRFVQSVTAWNRARSIVDEMQERVDIDVTPAMLERSRLAVSNRLALSIEAEYDVIRAQEALLRLIYGPRFTEFVGSEILTGTIPEMQADAVAAEPHVQRALQNRSEIHEAIRRIKASSLQLELARNEVQPVLDLVLTGYSAGLQGDNDIGSAWRQQFREGEPGVGVGFSFEMPHRNRAALAGAEQAQIAIHRMQSEFEATIGVVTEDVRNQVIQRNKYAAMLIRYREALGHASLNLKYAETRRQLLTDGPDVADLYLENLLQMQSRLTAAEFTFLQSQINCAIADSALSRAVGVLPMAAVVHRPDLPAEAPSNQTEDWQPSPATPPPAIRRTSWVHPRRNAALRAPTLPRSPWGSR